MTCRLSAPALPALIGQHAENVLLADTLARVVGVVQPASDLVLIGEVLNRTVGLSRPLADPVTLGEVLWDPILNTGTASLQITQQPSAATDNLAFSPPLIVTHPLGAGGAGVLCTITIATGANGLLIGTAAVAFNASGVATFTTLGINDTTM